MFLIYHMHGRDVNGLPVRALRIMAGKKGDRKAGYVVCIIALVLCGRCELWLARKATARVPTHHPLSPASTMNVRLSGRHHSRGGSGVDAEWGPLRSPFLLQWSRCRVGTLAVAFSPPVEWMPSGDPCGRLFSSSGVDAEWGPSRSPFLLDQP